jgi:two-component system, response regulator
MTRTSIPLVEDNPADVELTLRAFGKTRISNEIIVVGDGEKALRYLFSEEWRGGSALPAVVLLDLNLPRIDGLCVLRRMRADEWTKRLPVVTLTSSNEERGPQESRPSRASDHASISPPSLRIQREGARRR